MNRTILMLAVIAATFITGCSQGSILDSDFSEPDACIAFSCEAIEIEPASFHADSALTQVFKISSNRSWSLAMASETSWLCISRCSGINLGKVSREWSVILTFEDNAAEARETSLKVTVEGDAVELPVRQKKFEPVLMLDSPASYTLPEDGDTVKICVVSNCHWTAALSGTANAALSDAAGYKSGELLCVVKSNLDTSSGKEAVVVLSADGAQDITINITQDICIPRLDIDEELSETAVLPVAGDSKLVMDVNEPWTARLEEGASEGVTLSATSGGAGEGLNVCFPDATLETASATVVITTVSGLEDRITFVQRGCLFVRFRQWPDNNGASKAWQPWKIIGEGTKVPLRKTADPGAGTWNVEDADGYQYVLWSGNSEAVFYGDACGLTLGSIVDNPAFYIQFPAIEGKTLKGVELMLGNSDVKLKDNNNCEPTAKGIEACITGLDGNVVAGGQTRQVSTYQKDEDWNNTNTIPSFHSDYCNHLESLFRFELTGTEPGTAYRFTGPYRMVIRWFILYYE